MKTVRRNRNGRYEETVENQQRTNNQQKKEGKTNESRKKSAAK